VGDSYPRIGLIIVSSG